MIVTGSILFLDTSKYVPEHIHIMFLNIFFFDLALKHAAIGRDPSMR